MIDDSARTEEDGSAKSATEDLASATSMYLKVLDDAIAEAEDALEEMRAARGHLQRFGDGGDLAAIVNKFAPRK
jgi:hypothetical protein